MWAIKYSGTQDRSGFQEGKIVALAIDEQAVDAKIQKCVLKLKENYGWIKTAAKSETEEDPLSEETIGDHQVQISYQYKFKNQPETFVFSAYELSQKDSPTSAIERYFNIEEIKDIISLLGFESEVKVLKYVTSEELWPLLFIQFTEEENWMDIVRDKLHLLSLKIIVWASSLSYYCKYGGMDNKDHYIGLSLDIATANKKLIDATRSSRDDGEFASDDINEGSSTEPAMLSLIPEGRFVLTANTEKLGGDMSVSGIVGMLKKCPVSEFVQIFKACGLESEVNSIPKSLKTQKHLSRPLVRLYSQGVEAAKEALCHVVESLDPLTKKRKSEAVDVDTTGIAPKDIIKVMKKLECTKQQAAKWLLEKDLVVDDVLWFYGSKIAMAGFAEDVE